MRALILTLLITAAAPLPAQACGDLVDRVAAATKAEVDNRTADFANFHTRSNVTLTLACGEPSSVGVQYRGEAPPDEFYDLLGRAGEAVTGIDGAALARAAHTAQAAAAKLRHSNVDEAGARIVCSVSRSEKGPLTLCAVSEHSERG